jgi:hypothetical protein
MAALAEAKMAAGYWLRRGDSACVNGAAEFLRQTVPGLPSPICLGRVRGDAGFGQASVQEAAKALGLKFILVARLVRDVKGLGRHDDTHWQPTEVAGIEVQEVEGDAPGRRLVILRQRVAERPDAAGKTLIDVSGYRLQALVTNLSRSVSALPVWRRYHGRAEVENRIKELGDQSPKLFRDIYFSEKPWIVALPLANLMCLIEVPSGATSVDDEDAKDFKLRQRHIPPLMGPGYFWDGGLQIFRS